MFIGHYAVGFAFKRLAPRASLGTLFIAALWVDLIWPVFLLLGVERVRIAPGITRVAPLDFEYYPFSHSLLAVAIWAACLGLAYFAVRRSPKSAIVIGIAVLSHWFLDAIVHRPDLPISFTGDARAGLGLWDSITGTVLVEGAAFVIWVAVYLVSTSAKNSIGKYGVWALAVLLAVIYAAQFSGAAPPNETAVAFTGLSQWLFVLFGFWVDRNRRVAAGQS